MYPVLQAAIEMYKCGKTGKRDFTNNHMKEIFLFAFGVTPESGNKADCMIQLKMSDENNAEKKIENHWQTQWWLEQQHHS